MSLFFLHIPKTAGTSLRKAIEQQSSARVISVYNDQWQQWNHDASTDMPLSTIFAGHMPYGVHDLLGRQTNYITILRDPVMRIWSWYNHQRRSPDLPFYNAINNEGMTLCDFLESNYIEVTNHTTRLIAGLRDSTIETGHTAPATKHTLKLAKENIGNFRWIGIQEDLAYNLSRLEVVLDMPLNIPFLNSNPKDDILEPQIIEKIRRNNHFDVALYHYARDLVYGNTRWRVPGNAFGRFKDFMTNFVAAKQTDR